jgi:ABC-2 type transport system permease protein
MIGVVRILSVGAEVQLRHLAREPFMLMSAIVQPFFIATTVMLMYRGRPDFDPVYVVVGSGLAGLWTVALFEGNWAIGRERWQGTLELLTAAPSPLMVVLAGKMIGSMLFALISIATSYFTAVVLFGYAISVRDAPGFAVSLALGLGSLWAMAMLFAPLGILSVAAGYFLNIIEYPVYILAGFVFPILLLPFWTNPVSYALPPYWAAVALHGTSSATIAAIDLVGAWAMLIGTSILLVALTARLYGYVLWRARVAGTLGFA